MLSDSAGHTKPLQNVNEIATLGLRLDSLMKEIDKLSNVDLFKVFRTDRQILACISVIISIGVSTMLSMSFEGNKNVIRQPLKSLVARVNTFLDDEAVNRLRILE